MPKTIPYQIKLPLELDQLDPKNRIIRLKPLPGLRPIDYRVVASMKPELAKQIFANFNLYLVPKAEI